MANEEQTARPNLCLLPTPAPPSPWPPHSCSLRQGEGKGGYVVSQGENKQAAWDLLRTLPQGCLEWPLQGHFLRHHEPLKRES